MPIGAMRATKTPSCPAPLGNRVLLNPAAKHAFSIVLWINGEQAVGNVWLSSERVRRNPRGCNSSSIRLHNSCSN